MRIPTSGSVAYALRSAGIPHALALSVSGMLLAGAFQTWSHAFEPVPPPLSGERDLLSRVAELRAA